jgi:hypothetical protein
VIRRGVGAFVGHTPTVLELPGWKPRPRSPAHPSRSQRHRGRTRGRTRRLPLRSIRPVEPRCHVAQVVLRDDGREGLPCGNLPSGEPPPGTASAPPPRGSPATYAMTSPSGNPARSHPSPRRRSISSCRCRRPDRVGAAEPLGGEPARAVDRGQAQLWAAVSACRARACSSGPINPGARSGRPHGGGPLPLAGRSPGAQSCSDGAAPSLPANGSKS